VPSVDVPVALLGYGTVGAAVNRLLEEQGEEIERATGHRLRVVRALVRDATKERGFEPAAGVLTTNPADVLGDESIAIAAEVMGEFRADEDERLARKQEELAPFIEAAFKRKQAIAPLRDDEIEPVVALGRQIVEKPGRPGVDKPARIGWRDALRIGEAEKAAEPAKNTKAG